MEQSGPDTIATGEEAERLSLAADLRQLAEEAKALAQAEFAFQKSRAADAGAQGKAIAGLLLVAAVVVFFAVMALVVGAVLALGPVLGPWGATAAVTLALLAVAATCLLSARARARQMKSVLTDGGDAA